MADALAWLSEIVLTDEEKTLLSAVVQPGIQVEDIEYMQGDNLWGALSVCIRAYSTVKRAQGHLKPVLGKLLIALEAFPDLLAKHGFKSYDDFLTRGAPSILGLPRSEAYRAKRLAATWPNLTPEEFGDIGEGKLYDLSKFTNSEDPKAKDWIELAKNSTRDELRDKIVQSGNATIGDMLPAQVSFITTVDLKKYFHDYVTNPQVIAHVGTSDVGSIMSAAFMEAASSWGI